MISEVRFGFECPLGHSMSSIFLWESYHGGSEKSCIQTLVLYLSKFSVIYQSKKEKYGLNVNKFLCVTH